MCCEVLLLSVSKAVSLHAVPQRQDAIQETIKKKQQQTTKACALPSRRVSKQIKWGRQNPLKFLIVCGNIVETA